VTQPQTDLRTHGQVKLKSKVVEVAAQINNTSHTKITL